MIRIRLKEYMNERNMTLAQLSRDTGIRHATLHSIYWEKIDKLNLSYLDILMTEFDITDMNVLLEKVEEDI